MDCKQHDKIYSSKLRAKRRSNPIFEQHQKTKYNMKFSINYNGSVPLRDQIVKEIVAELEAHDHVLTSM